MPELRQNYFTKEWVIIATERAKRPEELATKRPAKIVTPFVEACPFCIGNEIKTPTEVMRVPANGSGPWQVSAGSDKRVSVLFTGMYRWMFTIPLLPSRSGTRQDSGMS